MSEVIALFPLTHVLMPGTGLPLRIFEPRYRQLLRDVTAPRGSRSFGVVGLTAGTEVADPDGAPPRISAVGTVAEITSIAAHADGTSELLAVGSRRFRIRDLVPGAVYLRARVDYLAEADGGTTPELCLAVTRLNDLFTRLALGAAGEAAAGLPADPALLSFALAGRLPLPPADRQSLLEEPTDAARLLRIARLLRRELRLLRATGSIAVAPGVVQLPVSPN